MRVSIEIGDKSNQLEDMQPAYTQRISRSTLFADIMFKRFTGMWMCSEDSDKRRTYTDCSGLFWVSAGPLCHKAVSY